MSTLIKKTDSFIDKYTLHSLKMGDLVEYLDLLKMDSEKQILSQVFNGLKVWSDRMYRIYIITIISPLEAIF